MRGAPFAQVGAEIGVDVDGDEVSCFSPQADPSLRGTRASRPTEDYVMGGMSITHWLVVGVIMLLLFGRGKVSELMGDVAKGIKSFKKGMAEDDDEVKPVDTVCARPRGAGADDRSSAWGREHRGSGVSRRAPATADPSPPTSSPRHIETGPAGLERRP